MLCCCILFAKAQLRPHKLGDWSVLRDVQEHDPQAIVLESTIEARSWERMVAWMAI